MRSLTLAAALFTAAACASSPGPEGSEPSAAPVVEAERAFARDGLALGIAASFNKWAVPGAVMIAGGRVSTVAEVYPPDRPRPPDEPKLEWCPNFAGIARSGDLGFTTGGVAVNGQRAGHYFTIWKKQSDGSWRWVYDGGNGATAKDVPGPETEPVTLPLGARLLQVRYAGQPAPPPPPADWALSEVKAEEAALAREAATDQKAAHLARMADDGRLYVALLPPAIGRAAFDEALTAWPATFSFGPTEGGGQSEYGDLVWTYGSAAWTRDGQARRGHYVRLWQRREEGFRIVLAQLIPAPPPQAPPAPN